MGLNGSVRASGRAGRLPLLLHAYQPKLSPVSIHINLQKVNVSRAEDSLPQRVGTHGWNQHVHRHLRGLFSRCVNRRYEGLRPICMPLGLRRENDGPFVSYAPREICREHRAREANVGRLEAEAHARQFTHVIDHVPSLVSADLQTIREERREIERAVALGRKSEPAGRWAQARFTMVSRAVGRAPGLGPVVWVVLRQRALLDRHATVRLDVVKAILEVLGEVLKGVDAEH